MPKGTLHLFAVLILAIGFWGGWKWWISVPPPSKPSQNTGGGIAGIDKGKTGGNTQRSKSRVKSKTQVKDKFSSFKSSLPENQFEEGELLVVDPPSTFESSARQMGFTIVERVSLGELAMNLYRVRIPAGTTTLQARQTLAGRFPGLTIDVNQHFEAQALKDYKDKTARPIAGWQAAKPTCGKGIELGMIDNSVDVNHPALKGQKIEFRSFHKKGRRPGPADHGTAVAAIMVGKPEWGGLLPGTKLKAASMFEKNKVGRVVGSSVALLKSINWLAKKKVKVINMSVAGGDNKIVRRALDKVKKKRMILVAAAGNWGSADRPAYPAAYKEVVAVTAFGEERRVYSKANRGQYIDFAAPGVQIYTAVSRRGGRVQSGPSFASPYVAVLVALELARDAKKSVDSLRKVLRAKVVDLGD
ncbi:MAG TPA: S8 family serine peptidase, partial [Rhodospirillales bacterium]|nr:S8 family serine peptidase [Rhodospirillales bacterium]